MVDLNLVFQNIGANWDKITTIVLAGWGAILSTIIYLQDRPRIKVGVKRGFTVGMQQQIDTLSLVIRNAGRRPIVVESAEFETSDRKSLFVFPNDYLVYDLPKKLDENEQITVTLNYDLVKHACIDERKSVDSVVFIDSIGNKYKKKLSWRYWSDLKWDNWSMFRRRLASMVYPQKTDEE